MFSVLISGMLKLSDLIGKIFFGVVGLVESVKYFLLLIEFISFHHFNGLDIVNTSEVLSLFF